MKRKVSVALDQEVFVALEQQAKAEQRTISNFVNHYLRVNLGIKKDTQSRKVVPFVNNREE